MAKSYLVPSATQQDFSAFFGEVSRDFGTALPHILAERAGHQEPTIRWRPLLTENLHPQILVGYGDPAVFKDERRLLAGRDVERRARRLSRSSIRRDLKHWEPKGFVFPAGDEPSWAAKGRNIADFWAPEMARVGDEYWLAFTARQASNALAIGIARSPSPLGPWIDNGAPLVTGTAARHHRPRLRSRPAADERRRDRFATSSSIRTATNISSGRTTGTASGRARWRCFCARSPISSASCSKARRTAAPRPSPRRSSPWANRQRPMVRFFLMQPLIEAALANWSAGPRARSSNSGSPPAILEAMSTPIRAPAPRGGRALAHRRGSDRAHQRPRLGGAFDRGPVRDAAGRPLLAVLRRQRFLHAVLRHRRRGRRSSARALHQAGRSRCCARRANGPRRAMPRSRRGSTAGRSCSSTPSIPAPAATTPSGRC